MSTRAQIQFEGTEILVYKHSDGYPDGVLPELTAFVAHFYPKRGSDASYATAQYLRWMGAKDNEDEGGRFGPYHDVLGWGVDLDVHGDIEYLYKVRRNGTIEVNKVSGGFDEPTTFQVIKRIPLKG